MIATLFLLASFFLCLAIGRNILFLAGLIGGALRFRVQTGRESNSLAAFKNPAASSENELSGQSFMILVPAHNEEAGILRTLQSLMEIDYPKNLHSVLVIADNCSDKTAEKARSAGVSVFERTDLVRKSKGFALEDIISMVLKSSSVPPDAFVIIDADTSVQRNLLQVFELELKKGHQAVQCFYGVRNKYSSWRTRLLHWSLGLFNGVWLMGQTGLGLSSALRGNGMCFSRQLLEKIPWKASGLAEDLEFSWILRLAGARVYFTSRACVEADMVSTSGAGAENQRARWEAGRAGLVAQFSETLSKATNFSHWQKWLLETDLRSKGLSSVAAGALAATFAFGLGACCVLFWSSLVPFQNEVYGVLNSGLLFILPAALLFIWATLVVYILSPIFLLSYKFRDCVPLLLSPVYMLWRGLVMIKAKPQEWVRTKRSREE